MKKCTIALLSGVAMLVLTTVPAYAVVEVEITDSLGTHTYVGASCGVNCSSVVANDGDAQFSINIQAGGSNGPGGPASVQVTGLVTALKAGTLTVEVSDTGFTSPKGAATLFQTVNTNTPGVGAASGSVAGTGYYGTGAGNVFFCLDTSTCTTNTPTATFNSFLVSNPGQTTSKGVNFVSPYSLDEALKYTFTSAGNADVTATLSAVVAPEPASLLFFGTGLLGVGLVFRKKMTSKNS